MHGMTPSTYRFHGYRLNPAQRQLQQGGQPVKLGSRAFDMLQVLVERRERVVGKHELMELVWPNLVVEENNLQVHVLALRKLLGHGAIATVPGRGYRFTLPVVAEGDELAVADPAAPPLAAPAGPALIGREQELQALRALVEEHPLVTVAGAGGIGKTRLAQGVASSTGAQPVCWVDLAGLSDPALVPAAVGRALGLVATAGGDDGHAPLMKALQDKAALLVLDNAEHLLDGVAAFVTRLREGASGVRLLITSQEVLRLLDEQVYRPGPLALPAGDDLVSARASGAVALFVARAKLADPRFTLGEHNHAVVADICRRLDGIPLAIELAAARVQLLGAEGLRQRLDERFNVLTAGSRAVMRRHQTLRAALDWSHGLLDAAEQRVLRRLGVFAGGFTLEAAQAVVEDEELDRWDVLEQLGALVDKSLVVADGDPVPRYRLLETARLYALERLAEAGETEALLLRHAQACLALAEAFDADALQHGRAAEGVQQLDAERDNLMHALAWCARAADANAEAAAVGLRLAAALRYYWPSCGLTAAGAAATRLALARAARLPGDRHRCTALGALAQMLQSMHRPGEVAPLAQELLVLGEAIAFTPARSVAQQLLGNLALHRADWAAARAHFEATLPLAREMDSLHHEGNALGGLIDVALGEGRPDDAAAGMDELLALRRRAGQGYNLAVTLQKAAWLSLSRGDPAEAATRLREAEPWMRGTGSRLLALGWCSLSGALAAARHHWAAAVQLQAATARGREEDGVRPGDDDLAEERAELDSARAAMGDAGFEAAWAAGQALGSAQMLALAAAEVAAQP